MTETEQSLTSEQLADYERDGFLIVRGLFSPDEAETLRERFMEIHREAQNESSPLRAHYQPKTLEQAGGDILQHFPRIMMPHRFDADSKKVLLNERIAGVLRALMGEEPLAAQSMLYFKPPGARGQAFHQDDFYLRTAPVHCMAAWIALDDCDAENGTLFVAPGSHELPVLCPHAADLTKSFSTEEVDLPADVEPVEVLLAPGDVLFFNGAVIHGSTPNTSTNRFRRAFICHYVPDSMTEMSDGYYPLHRFDGETLQRAKADGGGICGNEEWESYRRGVEFQLQKIKKDEYAQAVLKTFEMAA